MITLLDCLLCISEAVENAVSVHPTQINNLDRVENPGLYIVPTTINTSVEGMVRHDTYAITIGFYGNREDDRYIDLLEMSENLVRLFCSPISIYDFLLYPENLSSEVDAQEGTVFLSFTVNLYQEIEDEDIYTPNMSELLLTKE